MCRRWWRVQFESVRRSFGCSWELRTTRQQNKREARGWWRLRTRAFSWSIRSGGRVCDRTKFALVRLTNGHGPPKATFSRLIFHRNALGARNPHLGTVHRGSCFSLERAIWLGELIFGACRGAYPCFLSKEPGWPNCDRANTAHYKYPR